ncbi:MAG: Fis family transcriptional regulator [Spirochaetaceae bacterium 4572_59]|nr:MAG: Fis family transcriptional regulator [Spirochaetaceae bacterium 4572_59]
MIQDYEAILESISDGVFTVDKEWRISSFNRAAEEITGVSREEALGRPCSEVLRSSLCGNQCALRKTLKDGRALVNKKCYIINSEGGQIPISLSTAVFRDREGKIMGGAETFRDLSELESLKKYQLPDTQGNKLLSSKSPSMQQVLYLIEMVSPTDSTVIIYGETGTGKEVSARTVHDLSPRREEPFVAVNCAALPENLLESVLFGHIKGAFTGAVEDQQGVFARTGRGTLFLDEIGDISPALQLRLLRVLQEREYEPLGSSRTIKTEARIIAATHRNLKDRIAEGMFREDLYYRLNVVSINLPPLRERKEDLHDLTVLFIQRYNSLHNREILGIEADVHTLLRDYDWPGNIRELENVIERACILCRGPLIEKNCLPPEISGFNPLMRKEAKEGKNDLMSSREEAEIQEIRSALNQTANNKQAAADLLGIHKTTLFRKLKKYKI